MIYKVGLLPVSNRQQFPFAYKMYTEDNEWGWKQSIAFEKTFSMDVDIECPGVWLVFIISLVLRFFPYSLCSLVFFFQGFCLFNGTDLNTSTIDNFQNHSVRHAISLDERRARFQVGLWNVCLKQQICKRPILAKLLERNTNREKPTDVDKVTALSPVLPKKLTNFSFIKSGSLEPIPVILVSYI